MIFPGLDVTALSDSEIYKKIGELNAKLMFTYNSSGNSEIIEQLSAIIETLQFEQLVRTNRKSIEAVAVSDPVVVDTDPDLSSERKAAVVTKPGVVSPNAPFIPKRSKTPSSGI